MNRVTRESFFVIWLIIGFVLFTPATSMALMMGNDSDQTFLELEMKQLSTNVTIPPQSLREYLISGAGYYLDSYSDALAFLKKIELAELSGIDFSEMQALINSSLGNMELANEAYINLKIKAEYSTYNEEIIAKLKSFPYEQYRRTYGLYKSTFKELEDYLRVGDVRGAYAEMQANTENLLVILNQVKNSVDSSQFPDIPSLWKLNQSYSESMLFGQYMAGIFAEILKGI
jgi:hypothetical protein